MNSNAMVSAEEEVDSVTEELPAMSLEPMASPVEVVSSVPKESVVVNPDPMLIAVEEVNSVAEELRALRDKVKQYGDASKRLNDFGEILKDLNGSVGKIQIAFLGALERTEIACGQIDAEKNAVEKLIDSVPGIIKRIESSDVAKTINDFSDSMRALGVLLQTHEKTVEGVVEKFAEERALHAASLDDIKVRTEKVLATVSNLSSEVRGLQDSFAQQFQKLRSISDVVIDELSPRIKKGTGDMEELKGMLGDVRASGNKAIDTTADFAAKMLRDISALRGEVAASKSLIESQAKVLDEMSKRKRGFFG